MHFCASRVRGARFSSVRPRYLPTAQRPPRLLQSLLCRRADLHRNLLFTVVRYGACSKRWLCNVVQPLRPLSPITSLYFGPAGEATDNPKHSMKRHPSEEVSKAWNRQNCLAGFCDQITKPRSPKEEWALPVVAAHRPKPQQRKNDRKHGRPWHGRMQCKSLKLGRNKTTAGPGHTSKNIQPSKSLRLSDYFHCPC